MTEGRIHKQEGQEDPHLKELLRAAAQEEHPEATPEELEPPWDLLDPGIKETVRFLHDKGFVMYSSCEGGEGHGFYRPTVLVWAFGDTFFNEARQLLSALEEHGRPVAIVDIEEPEFPGFPACITVVFGEEK